MLRCTRTSGGIAVAEIETTVVTGIDGAMLSDDGYYCHMKFGGVQAEHVISLPSEQMMDLATLLIGLAGHAPTLAPGTSGLVQAMPVDWWATGKTEDGQQVVLSFRLPGGATFGFALGLQPSLALAEAIQNEAGSSPAQTGEVH